MFMANGRYDHVTKFILHLSSLAVFSFTVKLSAFASLTLKARISLHYFSSICSCTHFFKKTLM